MEGRLQETFARLKDESEQTKRDARRLICSLEPSDKDAVPELIALIRSGDEDFSYWAVRGLQCIGPDAKDAVPDLTKLLRTEGEDFRFWVVTALSSVGPEAIDAVPMLINLLQDPVFGVRSASADALVRIAPKADGVVPALVRTLANDQSDHVRQYVIRALGTIDTSESVTALVASVKDHDFEVLRWAAIGLKMLGFRAKHALPDVRKLMESETHNIIRGDLQIAINRMQSDGA